MKLTHTHIKALSKIYGQLKLRQKMNYTQLLLGNKNENRFDTAMILIQKAMKILNSVE